MTEHRYLTLDQQAAVLIAERFARDPATLDSAAVLLREVHHARPDAVDDDGEGRWLAGVLAKASTGLTVAEVRAERDRTLYRDGRRVRLPAHPCPHALRRLDDTEDPARERPCVHPGGAGHPGHCDFADVPAHAQRATMAQLRANVTRAAAAFGVRPEELVPGL